MYAVIQTPEQNRRDILIWLSLSAFIGGNLMAVFDFSRGQTLLALGESLYGFWGITLLYIVKTSSKDVRPWSLTLLIPFGVLVVFATSLPESTKTVFVWAQAFPVLSYILLGRFYGFWFSIVFVALAIIAYLPRLSSDPYEFMAEILDLSISSLVIMGFAHIYDRSREQAYRLLRDQADRDQLTGLKNRRGFDQDFQRLHALAQRQELELSLALIDLDHFKKINDTVGHQAGDQALRHAAKILKQRTRKTDLLARLGGEEFVICMLGCSAQECVKQVDGLREKLLATPLELADNKIRMTFSSGVAQLDVDGVSVSSLISNADRRLYRAKNSGRNRVF